HHFVGTRVRAAAPPTAVRVLRAAEISPSGCWTAPASQERRRRAMDRTVHPGNRTQHRTVALASQGPRPLLEGGNAKARPPHAVAGPWQVSGASGRDDLDVHGGGHVVVQTDLHLVVTEGLDGLADLDLAAVHRLAR